MPKITRVVHIPYDGRNYIYTVYAKSDVAAVVEATHKLERDLGKVHGAMKKEVAANIENIIVQLI